MYKRQTDTLPSNIRTGKYILTEKEKHTYSKGDSIAVPVAPNTGSHKAQMYVVINLDEQTKAQIKNVAEQNIENMLGQLGIQFTIYNSVHKERRRYFLDKYYELKEEYDKKMAEYRAGKRKKEPRKPVFPGKKINQTYKDIFNYWKNNYSRYIYKFAFQTKYYKRLKAAYKKILSEGKMVNGKWVTPHVNLKRLTDNVSNMFRQPIENSMYGGVTKKSQQARLVNYNRQDQRYLDTGGVYRNIYAKVVKLRHPRKNKLRRVVKKYL